MRFTSLLVVVCIAVSAIGQDKPVEKTKPELYVLSIGVDTGLKDKEAKSKVKEKDKYADAAELVAKAFDKASRKAFVKVNKKMLLRENADIKHWKEAMEWMGKMKANDVGVIHFSTHGGLGKKGYFVDLAGDDDLQRRNRVLWGDDLNAAVNKLPGKIVISIDTCHAAGILDKLAKEDGKVVYLCACRTQEESFGDYGHFAQAMYEGVQGAADFNHDGNVTVTELATYCDGRATFLAGNVQHGVFKVPAAHKSLVLARP